MNRNILRLAVPNILSNLTVPLLSSVDIALMGHLDSTAYLGAIAIGGLIFNFIYWGFGFLRMGTTGFTAQAYGQEDQLQSISILLRALSLAFLLGICIFILHPIIIQIGLMWIDGTAEVENFAAIYFNTRIYSAPATLILYVFYGWFLGMQNARYPLYLTFMTNLLNIIFNLLFVYEFGMNVEGVALGTVCANYSGVALAVILWKIKYSGMYTKVAVQQILNISEVRRFLSVNKNIFIRTLILIFAFAFFTSQSASRGELILAVNTILINLWTVMSYAIDGFAFAAESLVGRYYGARDRKKLQRSIRFSFYWGIGLGLLYSLVYAVADLQILRFFTDKNHLIQTAQQFIIWTIVAPPISSISYILDGIFIGVTAAKEMRNAMLLALFSVYLPVYYLSSNYAGDHALWIALIAFMVARSVFLGLYLRSAIAIPVRLPKVSKGC